MKCVILAAFALVTLIPRVALAETVTVKYRGDVALDSFDCQEVTDSSLVIRVCYDAAESYMLINLKGTYYHYCEIGPDVVRGLLAAPSKGKFFHARIKGSGSDGPYDCRTHQLPVY